MTMTKHPFKKCTTDILAFMFMVIAIPMIYLFELYMVLPTVHPKHTIGYYVHIMAGTYILIAVASNIYFIIFTDTTASATGLILPSILKKGWRFCSFCEFNAPPRSFHCNSCDKCVLKRDHHCVFSGNCIGFSNHRYYMSLVIWLSIAALYANIMNFDYVWEVFGGLSWRSVVSMVLPLMAWLLGVTQVFTFYVAIMSSLCVVGFLLMITLLSYHAMLIYKGQTVYEQSHKIKDYDYGWLSNVTIAMGKYWYIAWLCPLIPSPLPGNGIDWLGKETLYETVKDM